MAYTSSPFAGAQIDFSALSGIGENVGAGINRRRLSNALEGIDAGDYNAMVNAIKGIDPVLALKMASDNSYGGASVYGTPIWGRDSKTGKEGLGVIGKDGSFRLIDTGSFQPERGFDIRDLGYGYGPISKNTGTLGGPVTPKTGNLPEGYVPPQGYNPWAQPTTPQQPVPQGPQTAAPGSMAPQEAQPASPYMPGSPHDVKLREQQEKVRLAEEGKQRSADVVLDSISSVEKYLDTDPLIPATGFFGGVTQNIPGTAAHDVQQLLEPIAANISFDKISEIRRASPTGGALGPVSDFEVRRLAATLGSVAQSQNDEQFRTRLKKLREYYLEAVHGPEWRNVVPEPQEEDNDPLGMFR